MCVLVMVPQQQLLLVWKVYTLRRHQFHQKGIESRGWVIDRRHRRRREKTAGFNLNPFDAVSGPRARHTTTGSFIVRFPPRKHVDCQQQQYGVTRRRRQQQTITCPSLLTLTSKAAADPLLSPDQQILLFRPDKSVQTLYSFSSMYKLLGQFIRACDISSVCNCTYEYIKIAPDLALDGTLRS